MMRCTRNRYTKDFEHFIRENVSKYTKEELRQLIQDIYNIQMSNDALRRYLNRHQIKSKYINYKKYNARDVYKCPIGTERTTSEGVFVKIVHPDKWRRKSRIMYEKYHNCKLKDNEYVVFLNRNTNDFRKGNLVKCSKTEIAYLRNKEMFSSNAEITNLGILTSKLMIKAKEVATNEKVI